MTAHREGNRPHRCGARNAPKARPAPSRADADAKQDRTRILRNIAEDRMDVSAKKPKKNPRTDRRLVNRRSLKEPRRRRSRSCASDRRTEPSAHRLRRLRPEPRRRSARRAARCGLFRRRGAHAAPSPRTSCGAIVTRGTMRRRKRRRRRRHGGRGGASTDAWRAMPLPW